jgi:hypothetical protein
MRSAGSRRKTKEHRARRASFKSAVLKPSIPSGATRQILKSQNVKHTATDNHSYYLEAERHSIWERQVEGRETDMK